MCLQIHPSLHAPHEGCALGVDVGLDALAYPTCVLQLSLFPLSPKAGGHACVSWLVLLLLVMVQGYCHVLQLPDAHCWR